MVVDHLTIILCKVIVDLSLREIVNFFNKELTIMKACLRLQSGTIRGLLVERKAMAELSNAEHILI